jgi:hypothetical protein
MRIAEIEAQIEKLMGLFTRGKIKAEIIEKTMEPLQTEKEDLEIKTKDISDMNEILDIKVEEFSSDAIRNQLARFEEMVSDQNVSEMRNMVRDFIYKIELFPKKDARTKKWLLQHPCFVL